MIDVWSRTEPKYRRRAILLLTVNAVLFGALGCFTYWLRTGDPFPVLRPLIGLFADPPDPSRYPYGALMRNSLRLTGPKQSTLSDIMVFPISVENVPAHMIIVGLLIASLVTIPILVAMLYRLPTAIGFLLIVGFVAVLPWLALTLLLSCIIATIRPFRFSFRYATFLLSLSPVVVYFFASTQATLSSAVALLAPVERMKLYFPWMLAMLATCLGAGVVLTVAHLINYRPGGIAPLLAVLFVVPVVLFMTEVGADEMEYRLLEYDYGPGGSRVFMDLDTRGLVESAAEREWITREQKDEKQIKAIIQNKLVQLKLLLPTELARQQEEVVQRCDSFIRRHPSSRYVPNCLYLRGRALDMRIDMEQLRYDAMLQFYSDFPSEASRETWKELLRSDSDSPFAGVAGMHLALLEAREGNLRNAQDLLQRVVERFRKFSTTMTSAPAHSGLRQLLERKPAGSRLLMDPLAVADEAAQLLSLIRENKEGRYEDLVYPDNNPVSLMLRCDPKGRDYAENLLEIERRFPGCQLSDNLILERALTERDVNVRRAKLREVASRHKNGDAAPRAMYALGLLELDQNRRAEGREVFESLLKQYPNSPWAGSAQRKLIAIEITRKVR